MPKNLVEKVRQHLPQWMPWGKPRTRFERMTDQFIRRLRLWPAMPPKVIEKRKKIGVLISPWLETAVPFFSIECALSLAKDEDVTLIWDPVNIRFNTRRGHETESLIRCLDRIKKWLPVVDVSKMKGLGGIDRGFLEIVQYENAVARTLGEQKAVELSERHGESLDEMAAHAGRIRALLQTQQFDWLYVPGGVWGTSAIYLRVAEEMGVSTTTFDSGEGIIFITHDGAAAHFADMLPAFRDIMHDAKKAPAERDRMRAAAHEVLEVRRQGTDQYKLQPKSSEAAKAESWDILLPLNYRSDTAAMCRQRLFPSVKSWLEQVLAWVKEHPPVTIAIRQHPCEKIPEFRGSDQWSELIKSYDLGDRCRFIAAEDEVNTYDLLSKVRAVLPCTSRVGIEAAILDKPVILGWECYFQECGFAWNARTTKEYFSLIERALSGELTVSADARLSAEITYYIAEKCFGMETVFTPVPVDFHKWVQMPPQELWSTPELKMLRETLLTRQPLAVLRNRRWKAASSPATSSSTPAKG